LNASHTKGGVLDGSGIAGDFVGLSVHWVTPAYIVAHRDGKVHTC